MKELIKTPLLRHFRYTFVSSQLSELPRTSHTWRLVFVIYFKIRKLSGYIFRLHLVIKSDNLERLVLIVKLLRLN